MLVSERVYVNMEENMEEMLCQPHFPQKLTKHMNLFWIPSLVWPGIFQHPPPMYMHLSECVCVRA